MQIKPGDEMTGAVLSPETMYSVLAYCSALEMGIGSKIYFNVMTPS